MIIIPDIHGRSFWKDAVMGHETEEILFLGDYVDPYTYYEDVNPWDGLTSLKEVIAFKKEHPENVTLLLGNHDLSYMSQYVYRCRHDDENHSEIRKLLMDNLHLFRIAYEKNISGTLFQFSHAGILRDWLQQNEMALGQIKPGHEVEELNRLFLSGKLYQALGDVSAYRGGECEAGSCVWADINEHFDYESRPDAVIYRGIYQIFGHTLQEIEKPIITEHFACLDCRHAFFLDDSGKLSMM